MARDHAGDRFLAVVAVADPDADAVADPQPLAPPRVVDLDLDRPDGDELARLPRPREVGRGVAAETTGEDPSSAARCSLVARASRYSTHVHGEPGLVVAVADGQRDREPGEVDVVHGALLDQPREHAHADPVRRAAAGTPSIRRQGQIASQLHDSK